MSNHKKLIWFNKEGDYLNFKYNNNIDKFEGDIIFQAKTSIDINDTAESLAKKIHLLEYEHYPQIIEKLISKDSH